MTNQMTDFQLYIAAGLPTTAVLASLTIGLVRISGIRVELAGSRDDIRGLRDDLSARWLVSD